MGVEFENLMRVQKSSIRMISNLIKLKKFLIHGIMILLNHIRHRCNPVRYATSYEKKTPLEHILLRPGMYIGQVEPAIESTWVINSAGTQMEKANLAISPGLLKVDFSYFFIALFV